MIKAPCICWHLHLLETFSKNSTWCSQCAVFLQSQILHCQRVYFICSFQWYFWSFIICVVKVNLGTPFILVPRFNYRVSISVLVKSFITYQGVQKKGRADKTLEVPSQDGAFRTHNLLWGYMLWEDKNMIFEFTLCTSCHCINQMQEM